ncbi:MAG: methylmalonyl-CoA epimerase [Bdellovibrionota bacterium]
MIAPARDKWKLDHIGHAVQDLTAATAFYTETLGFSVECRETLEEQRIDIVFCRMNDTLVELLAPLEGDKVLSSFLQKRGPGLHHICYRVASVSSELRSLSAAGVKLIDQEPRLGSRNLQVAFLHPSSCAGVLIELCGES